MTPWKWTTRKKRQKPTQYRPPSDVTAQGQRGQERNTKTQTHLLQDKRGRKFMDATMTHTPMNGKEKTTSEVSEENAQCVLKGSGGV